MNDEIKSLIFEACNEWVSMGLPRTHEIHECFMRSTGDRDKHPAPLCALAKWALTDDVRPTPSEEARLVSYHPDGDTCTLNINGVEMYYDRVDRDTQPAPSAPEGWMRAIDEALVAAHIGVANAHDTYEQAKAKLDNLVGFNVDIATDPAVNGGWKLVPIEPTPGMIDAAEYVDWGDADVRGSCINAWNRMLSVAPEAKT